MAKRSNRLELTLSDERLARLDQARGHEPRASFVKRALEQALGTEHDAARATAPSVRDPGAFESPAPARTSARRKPSVRETWAR